MNKQMINKADWSGEEVELVSYKNGNFRADYLTGNLKMIAEDHAKVTLDQGTVIDVIKMGSDYWMALIDWQDDYTREAADPITAAVQLAFNVI